MDLKIGAVQGTIIPVSTDNTIHVSSDKRLAVIFHRDDLASVFRDTDQGLSEALWAREGDAAPRP